MSLNQLSEIDQMIVKIRQLPFGWKDLKPEHPNYQKTVEAIKKIIDLEIEKSIGFSITFSSDYKRFLKSASINNLITTK